MRHAADLTIGVGAHAPPPSSPARPLAPDPPDPPGSPEPTRRRLLLGAATVAAAGWVAPQITSVAGAQACPSAICTVQTYSWLSSPFGNGVNITAGSYAVGGTTITATRSNTDTISNGCPSGVNTTTGVITSNTWGGDANGVLPICRVGNGNPQSASITLNFSTPVRQLGFTLLDIDAWDGGAVQYREEAVLSWTVGSGAPGVSYTPGGNLASTGTNAYAVTSTSTNCPCSGTGSGACNLGVQFDACGTISSLAITTNDLNTTLGTSGSQGRAVCVSALSFCI